MREMIEQMIMVTVDMWGEFFSWVWKYKLFVPSELMEYIKRPRRIILNRGTHFANDELRLYVILLLLFLVVGVIVMSIETKINKVKLVVGALCLYLIGIFPVLLFMAIWAVGNYFTSILISVLLVYSIAFFYMLKVREHDNEVMEEK